MPRVRKRTTNNRSCSSEQLKVAVETYFQTENRSVRSISQEFEIPRITLIRYIKKCRNKNLNEVNFRPNNEHLLAFTKTEETALASHIKELSNMHYGITSKQARQLAYEFAVANNRPVKEKWSDEKMANEDWLRGFRERHRLSLRTPEQTSLTRATSFNAANVAPFFQNLREIKAQHKLEAKDIYNLDETSTTTVHKPPKVLAQKGTRNVGQMTSVERGTLVTTVGIISAIGTFVPPFLVFPRVNFRENMLCNAPPGSKGAASPSGWMNSSLFLSVLKHFADNERPNQKHPKLIILDNHESHLSIEALQFAKDQGIILLTLPPHCSHKMQPLDKAVYGPFKRAYNEACDRWMVNHPGKTITIYDIAGLIGEAFPLSFTQRNIINGFRACGIEPFNDTIFSEADFVGASVTDRPAPNTSEHSVVENEVTINECDASTSVLLNQIHPLPKAAPRQGTSRRKKGKSLILTSTPVKDSLEEEARLKQARKTKSIKKVVAVKKKVFSSSSSSEDEVNYEESSCFPEVFSDEESNPQIVVGNYCLVKIFSSNETTFRHYVAKIMADNNDGYDVKFLKRHMLTSKFRVTDEEGFVPKTDVVEKLPQPIVASKRYENMLFFDKDFTEYGFTVY